MNLWADSKNDLLIQFWDIDFICLLDSCDLDCFVAFVSLTRLAMTGIFAFDSHFTRLAMTGGRFAFDSWIALRESTIRYCNDKGANCV